jgi:hypothetical protein
MRQLAVADDLDADDLPLCQDGHGRHNRFASIQLGM